MPTNEERHNAAVKIRLLGFAAFHYPDSFKKPHLQCIGEAIGCKPGDDIFDRLADLIDHETDRTCHIEKHQPKSELYFETCSECGCILSASWPGDRHSKTANYCPNCGAKVVNDADQ